MAITPFVLFQKNKQRSGLLPIELHMAVAPSRVAITPLVLLQKEKQSSGRLRSILHMVVGLVTGGDNTIGVAYEAA